MSKLKNFISQHTDLYREYSTLQNSPPRSSAKGALKILLARGNSNEERLDELEKRILAQPSLFPVIGKFSRNATQWLTQGIFNTMQTTVEGYSFSWLCHPKQDAFSTELAALNSNVFELMGLCVWQVHREHPECFGPWDSISQYQARLTELKGQLDEIYTKMEKIVTQSDLSFSEPRKDGSCAVWLAMSKGQVFFVPGWPKRLLEWAANSLERSEREEVENVSLVSSV